MPNPKPTYFTTGNYPTRADLRAAIHYKRRKGKNWKEIGKECGVSEWTAKRCHSEEEAIRKEARREAYETAERSGLSGRSRHVSFPKVDGATAYDLSRMRPQRKIEPLPASGPSRLTAWLIALLIVGAVIGAFLLYPRP